MILVTGATGTIGQAVVRELAGRGVGVRALTRDPAHAQSIFGSGVECAAGTFEDEQSLKSAMAGVERVFMLSPIHPDLARREGSVVVAARSANVRHIVKLSTAGIEWVDQGPPVPALWALHREAEQEVEQSGVPFTHLRPDACMQNVLMFAGAIATGIYPAPTGDGRRAWVDVRDVAAAAAVVLTSEGHEGRSYELTGPEALSDDGIAAIISQATGTEVKRVDPPIAVATTNMIQGGMPAAVAEMIGDVMTAIAAGRSGKVTGDVEQLTGQQPRAFAAFAAEHRSAFVGH